MTNRAASRSRKRARNSSSLIEPKMVGLEIQPLTADRQHRTASPRIETSCRTMLSGRPRLGFAIADNARDERSIVERCAERCCQRIAELAAFVNRARMPG